MRKILLGVAALAAVATPIIATAGSANAATANADGSVTVTKGDVQSAMGWNNTAWETNTDTPAEVTALAAKITASDGIATPVDVPGGWLTLNGAIVANYPSDEYYDSSFTNPENWGPFSTPVSSYWEDSVNTAVTPIKNAQQKITGFKVTTTNSSKDNYVYYTRHTTYTNPDYNGATYVYHATSRWPASVAGVGSISDVKVIGTPVTVTPAA